MIEDRRFNHRRLNQAPSIFDRAHPWFCDVIGSCRALIIDRRRFIEADSVEACTIEAYRSILITFHLSRPAGETTCARSALLHGARQMLVLHNVAVVKHMRRLQCHSVAGCIREAKDAELQSVALKSKYLQLINVKITMPRCGAQR